MLWEGEAVESCLVHRASDEEIDRAFKLVKEYYEEVGVVVREDQREFAEQYFGNGAGVWMAAIGGDDTGCIALRRMDAPENCGEVKRMYVRETHRGSGIAAALLYALEEYARKSGYLWLYLDTTDAMRAAARFYERNGYQLCERYNSNPQATIFMRKKIAARKTKSKKTR